VAKQKLEVLEPAHELMNNKNFQVLIADLEKEVEELKELVWALNFNPNSNLVQERLLDHLGLKKPENLEDIRTVMFAVRATVHFMSRKLKHWELQTARYDNIAKEFKDG